MRERRSVGINFILFGYFDGTWQSVGINQSIELLNSIDFKCASNHFGQFPKYGEIRIKFFFGLSEISNDFFYTIISWKFVEVIMIFHPIKSIKLDGWLT